MKKKTRARKAPSLNQQLLAKAIPLLAELERKTGLVAEQIFTLNRHMQSASEKAGEAPAIARDWGIIQIECQTHKGPKTVGKIYDWTAVGQWESSPIDNLEVGIDLDLPVCVTRIVLLALGGTPSFIEYVTAANKIACAGPVVDVAGLRIDILPGEKLKLVLKRN